MLVSVSVTLFAAFVFPFRPFSETVLYYHVSMIHRDFPIAKLHSLCAFFQFFEPGWTEGGMPVKGAWWKETIEGVLQMKICQMREEFGIISDDDSQGWARVASTFVVC